MDRRALIGGSVVLGAAALFGGIGLAENQEPSYLGEANRKEFRRMPIFLVTGHFRDRVIRNFGKTTVAAQRDALNAIAKKLVGVGIASVGGRECDQLIVELGVHTHARGAQAADQPAQDLFDLLPANFLCLHFDQGVAVFLLPISRFGHEFCLGVNFDHVQVLCQSGWCDHRARIQTRPHEVAIPGEFQHDSCANCRRCSRP